MQGVHVAPTPRQIYDRAVVEGERRLAATTLELISSGFNAGFTVVFGVAAFGVVHGAAHAPLGPEAARVTAAAAFAIGMLFLVVSRAELFSENFFDPVATLFERRDQRTRDLARLWVVVLCLNLVGGALLTAILSVEGVLPASARDSLRTVGEEVAVKGVGATFATAVVGGALVTLLSFLLQAVDRVLGRMVVAYLVGFLLAATPLAHAVVTAQHLLFAEVLGAHVGLADIAATVGVVVGGNVVGGLAFVTLTHIAQARSSA